VTVRYLVSNRSSLWSKN